MSRRPVDPERLVVAPSNLAREIDQLAGLATDDMLERTRKREAAASASMASPVFRQRVSLIALCVALPLLAFLIGVSFFADALTELFSPAPSPQVAAQQSQAELDVIVGDIESFRKDFSALPQTLVQVGAAAHGEWTYTRGADGHYQVVRRLHGGTATFDSRPAQDRR